MGKGDRRSRKGKIWRGSHGNTRPKPKSTYVAPAKAEAKAEAKPAAKPEPAETTPPAE